MTASDLSGQLRDGVHIYRVRVYYDDTDAGGVIYYANYLRIAERARTELVRLLGHGHTDLMARKGVMFAVRRCEIDYLRPGRLDDLLEVHSRITQVGGASMRMEQTIRRGSEELAHLKIRLACITSGGGTARFPDYVRKALSPLVNDRLGATEQEQRA